MVRASPETSALRQQQNNVKSQKSTGGRTDATGLHKGALTEYCQCRCHTRPYTRILAHRSRCVNILEAIRCNPWTLKKVARSRMRVNLNTVSSLQLIVSNLLFCLEFHGVGDKHSKHLSHPHAPVIRLQGLLFQCTTLTKHVEDLFPSSDQQQQLKNTSWSISRCTIRHVATSQGQEDPTRQRSSCQVLFVSYQQVRCHKNVNMSTKICVCVDRDVVQMVSPVSSQQTRLQFCGCLKTEPKLLSGNWRVPTPVRDGRVP